MKTNTGWTSSGHTGVDVEVFAFGAGSQAFTGQLDNTDIAVKLKQFVDGTAVAKGQKPAPVTQPKDENSERPCDFKEDWRCL